MCGINGTFAYGKGAPAVNEAELLQVRDYMEKRGPDGAGTWISADRRVGLGHRRLAIIDLTPTGHQPMASRDGRLAITFNGEIYNYRALRSELEAKGYTFTSSSDTEVLLHLYADRGERMLDALRGMFAFVIWDSREQVMFLARDAFGIKPLYYADDGRTLRFASQVKALVAGGAVDIAPEPAGAVGFLLWGCVPEPFTLHRGIHALPAGSCLTLARGGSPRIATYFSIREVLEAAQPAARPFTAADRGLLGGLLSESVRDHLVSDVPVGMFLSAGVDSTLVATIAAEQSDVTLRTLTLGFEEYKATQFDETPFAEATAASLQTHHETHWIRREDFATQRDAILAAMDQPTTDGINTYFVCQEAARAGIKVALSGLGGDEIFGGYPSFRDVPRIAAWLRPSNLFPLAGKLARILSAPLAPVVGSPKLAGLLEYGGTFQGAYLLRRALYMPWELRQVLDPVAIHVGLERLGTLHALAETIRGLKSGHARVASLELQWYMRNQLLRDADWAGMAHSIEVRVPMIDAVLFRALAPWLVSDRPPMKHDVATTPRHALSRSIVDRPKSGFTVPVREWLVAEATPGAKHGRGLRGWAARVLPAQPKQIRTLALVTDAFGGRGGIAKFNRDFITALAEMPGSSEVVVVPRLVPYPLGTIPRGVLHRFEAARGKVNFAISTLGTVMRGPFDVVIVGHINLSALGILAAWIARARTALVIHGIDAWTPHRSVLVRRCVRHIDRVIGVSNLTLDRFNGWAKLGKDRLHVLPNCVDIARYSPRAPREDLRNSLGLSGRTVLMTMGRLAEEERNKGFDEVLEALPELAKEIPEVAYLICGDGPDRQRLEEKASRLKIRDRVKFAGFVDEDQKPNYYQLADAYVMPSRGEGFGIVLLEALASGLPTLASSTDGGREALDGGQLGDLVDPTDKSAVVAGILRTLSRGKSVPAGLAKFSEENFKARTAQIVESALR